ncbi:hypothetical protein ADU59_25275 [Pararhizobium polonicum]|uniref:Uncharacterized protein n=1 Tax=Pararhizobium polonicum TaxID=1612624 RepID=A0A1C7NUV5_9HYPH|nr:hypothetical protein [Pararhizobium polonicum]OBZ92787.1 hypothetical protein ADU59_25275 [Pararhizobium polonicum]
MTYKDLSIADVLTDPLIRQVMRADGVSLSGMALLLHTAARKQKTPQKSRHVPEAALRMRGSV